jgi:hypothetical protein
MRFFSFLCAPSANISFSHITRRQSTDFRGETDGEKFAVGAIKKERRKQHRKQDAENLHPLSKGCKSTHLLTKI